ncbi:hypothetical protein OF83DRAFT_1072616, partial [Amylostereum chailletii]
VYAFLHSSAASRLTSPRTPYAILDEQDRVIAVLLGRPLDGDEQSPEQRWDVAMARLAALLEEERSRVEETFQGEMGHHRRGDYAALSFGLSYGGGQKVRFDAHTRLLERVLGTEDAQRLAGFGSDGLASYFPKAYRHHRERMQELLDSDDLLQLPFKCSVYPTCTLNMGPRSACHDHNDCTNYSVLPCSVTVLVSFNPDEGGHFYFWDLKMVVRFPPGATILLSSSGLRHGNVGIKDGETRYSVTQYCVGGLVRWVSYFCVPAKLVSDDERDRLDRERLEGWREQLSRLSFYHQLDRDREELLEWERSFCSRK